MNSCYALKQHNFLTVPFAWIYAYFLRMIFLASIVCFRVSLFWELQSKDKNCAKTLQDYSCKTKIGQTRSKHLARISWLKFNVLIRYESQSRILHEYLDYENLWFLNLKILKSQARSRSSGAISNGFFRFEIKKIFSVWYS